MELPKQESKNRMVSGMAATVKKRKGGDVLSNDYRLMSKGGNSRNVTNKKNARIRRI
ncbi:MAG: hypothetical protein V1872_06025 [bacterium]